MEDYRAVLKLMHKDCFFTTFDLKDAYYLIPLDSQYKKFLKFWFDKKVYQFNCLPFGLSSAPFIFTKLLRPILQQFRSQGITLVAYLDDLIIVGRSYDECLNYTLNVEEDLKKLGFLINYRKSKMKTILMLE